MRTYPLTIQELLPGFFVATSSEVPGLCLAGHSPDELRAEAKVVIPELLRAQEDADARNH